MGLNATELGILTETRDAALEASDLAKRHDKTLYGNGKPGLCTDVQVLQDARKNRKESIALVIATLSMIGTLSGVAYMIVDKLI